MLPIKGRLLHIVVVVSMCFVLFSATALSQPHPNSATRQRFADSLNAAKTRGDTLVKFGSSIITLADGISGCDTLQPGALALSYDAVQGTFTLKRQTRGRDTIHVDHFDHRLAGDLNHWLQAMWGMNLKGVPAFDSLGWPMRGCIPYQRFYTDTTSLAACVDAIKDLSYENEILATTYTNETTSLVGASFLSFSESSPRILRFITDRGDTLAAPPDTIRRLANGFLRITLPGCDTFRLKWAATTQAYSSGCGFGFADVAKWEFYINGTMIWDFYTGNPGDTDGTNSNFLRVGHDFYHADSTLWESIDPDSTSDASYGAFGVDSAGYLTFSLYHGSGHPSYFHKQICRLINTVTLPDSCSITLCASGTFQIDPATGGLIYVSTGCGGTCTPIPIACLEFCDAILPSPSTISGAISVGVTTFTDQWLCPIGIALPNYRVGGGIDPETGGIRTSRHVDPVDFEFAFRGKWRPLSSYIYRTDVTQGTGLFGNTNQRAYLDAGVFQFTQFDWHDSTRNDTVTWIKTAKTTAYSPNGDAMEEEDALGIRSAAWYDPDIRLPILVAANAGYRTVQYNSFEKKFTQVAVNTSHSGSKSLVLAPGETGVGLEGFGADAQSLKNGILIEFWAKRRYLNLLSNQAPVKVVISSLAYGGRAIQTYTSYDKIAQTGDWALYSIESHDFIPGDTVSGIKVDVRLTDTFANDSVWIDDIRVQPLDAEMQCFVYDPAFKRLAVSFDNQHFGTYYQYNGEGQLVRKIQETERGMKTIEERQYHMPLVDRLPGYSAKAGHAPTGGSNASSYSRIPSSASNGDIEEGSPSGPGAEGKFDLLDIEIDKNGVKAEGPRLKSVNGLDMPKLPSFSEINIPELADPAKYEAIKEIDSLDQAAARIRSAGEGTDTKSQEESMEQRLNAIAKRKKELLEKIGMSDEEVRRLTDQVRAEAEGKELHIQK